MVQQAKGKRSPPEAGLSGAQESSPGPPGSPLWAGRSHKGQNENRKVQESRWKLSSSSRVGFPPP